ncbi:hypothetical protein G7Y89_g1066 [Cudoniella acicularis]|uniref:Uncharacterized protein n=1 Tax=Cudoniella acicularis TaxID=354080 RepID=A0A8H4RW09_9HELO|nr:hypothetical protein G7Y89_g1066 [Cudoniella acicularis]
MLPDSLPPTSEGARAPIERLDESFSGDGESALDGPTSDKSAGIGVEFESFDITFKSNSPTPCDELSTFALKRKMVGERFGQNWVLTADTTSLNAGYLSAEYILNGKTIKIGTGALAAAAAGVANNIASLNTTSYVYKF